MRSIFSALQRLAELLGGSVEVASELGKGSTFSVIIPVHFEAEKMAAPQAGAGISLVKEREHV
jgi:hypothetical protein